MVWVLPFDSGKVYIQNWIVSTEVRFQESNVVFFFLSWGPCELAWKESMRKMNNTTRKEPLNHTKPVKLKKNARGFHSHTHPGNRVKQRDFFVCFRHPKTTNFSASDSCILRRSQIINWCFTRVDEMAKKSPQTNTKKLSPPPTHGLQPINGIPF